MRRFAPALCALGLAALSACPPRPVPGDEQLGRFTMRAESVDRQCNLEEVSSSAFDFDVTFSRQSDASVAWATMAGYPRDATWDGQVLSSTSSAPRVFQACGDCSTVMFETLEVSLLSRSQTDAVDGVCPAEALDGGTPRPDDAGITAPGVTRDGFDSVLACGELRTWLEATDTDAGACADVCRVCTRRYRLTGIRR